ncbi:MAG: hypothetical protein ABIL11_04090, partial [Chloroflexota bacterium]
GMNRIEAFYLTDAGQPRAALRAYWRACRLHPPTALGDWNHALLAVFSLLGLHKLRALYDRLRTRHLGLKK